jgi:hypothetical protein
MGRADDFGDGDPRFSARVACKLPEERLTRLQLTDSIHFVER